MTMDTRPEHARSRISARAADGQVPDAVTSHTRIHAVVRAIPAGRVSTYGDVAVIAGLPGQARLVGYALHALPEHTAVPWHRVINARGGISVGRAYPGGELVQRQRLAAEGIVFDSHGRVDLRRYRWYPEGETEADQQAPGIEGP